MALDTPLATYEEYKAVTGMADVDADQDQIEGHIVTATALIHRFAERNFNSVDSTRYFDGEGGDVMWVPDLTAVTSIKFDRDGDGTYEETLSASDYVLRDYNAAERGEPYTEIVLRTGTLPQGLRAVEITATWGWPSVPQPVRDAAINLARQLRELAETGPTLTAHATDEELQVKPGMFSLLSKMQTEYSRRLPIPGLGAW